MGLGLALAHEPPGVMARVRVRVKVRFRVRVGSTHLDLDVHLGPDVAVEQFGAKVGAYLFRQVEERHAGPGWSSAVKWATLEAADSSSCEAVAGIPMSGFALGVPTAQSRRSTPP